MVGAAALAFAGCATPGPLHLYSVSSGAQDIHDAVLDAQDVVRDVPSFLQAGDELTGFAYDSFTDHFFLRLAPGNHVRVVDRPARKIKLEFTIEGAPTDGGGDLALNPRTGHLYLVDPAAPQIVETTRLGKYLHTIKLEARTEAAAAIAYDSASEDFLILGHDGRTVEQYDSAGKRLATLRLDRRVAPSLAYSPDTRLIYAPLADGTRAVGAFDFEGHLLRTIPLSEGDRFIDVGPHSFLRVF